jgi:hypothetical protein
MRSVRGAGVLAVACLTTVGTAMASGGVKLCVPKQEGGAVLTPKHGKCRKGYKLTGLGAEGREGKRGTEGKPGSEGRTGPEGKAGSAGFTSSELEVLKALLTHIKYVGVGIDGKPTVQFSGVNVQIVNGAGKTGTVNGVGNLAIGYDENEGKHEQTGSHNLILGSEQTFTSYGGLLGGFKNATTAPYASVSGGYDNAASGELSSVSGGGENAASAGEAAVSGGVANAASEGYTSVSGGQGNTAGAYAAWVGGGNLNRAEGFWSSVFGGKELKAKGEYEAMP